jgi:hypothetical protein
LINEDCTIKVCDFGLARSTTGVESATWMVETSKKKKDMTGEIAVTAGDDEEFMLKD